MSSLNKLVSKKELERTVYKSLSFKNKYFFLSNCIFNKNNSFKSIKKRRKCLLTARGRGYYRCFELSRNQLRVLNSISMLPGLKKSSW